MKHFRSSKFLLSLLVVGVIVCSCRGESEKEIVVQAHRGGAALFPENTIPAMVHAVTIGTKTLELDLQVTRDSQIVVSHDAYLNSLKALFPDGERITKRQEDSLLIFTMDYDSLRKFDVGSLPNPVYPRRKNLKSTVPLLTNLIDCIEAYTLSSGRSPVCYNIEIKSSKENDGIRTPDYKTYCDLSMKVLLEKNLKDRLCIQSFDPRSLNYIHRKYPEITLSYLVEDNRRTVSEFLKDLDFVPQVISPLYSIVSHSFVADAHDYQMKVIPWTVDAKEDVLRMAAFGVDEIITNEPDSVQSWLDAVSRNHINKKAVQFYENLMGY